MGPPGAHDVPLELLRPRGRDRILALADDPGALAHRIRTAAPDARVLVAARDGVPDDRSREAPADARGVHPLHTRANALPVTSGGASKLLLAHVLHRLPDPEGALVEARRVLAPDGRLVLVDRCRDAWRWRLWDPVLRAVRRDHVRTYTRAEVQALLGEAGFVVEEARRWSDGWGSYLGVRARPQASHTDDG